jgi:MFS family permease
MIAVASFCLLVRERPLGTIKKETFWKGLQALTPTFRRFLMGVGIFGSGDFSHTLLILYGTQMLAPSQGTARAASLAVGLYTLHNVFYAGSAYVSGWISDHVRHRKAILAGGYALAGVTAIFLTTAPHRLLLLAPVFALAGLYVGTEEALEDSLAAELMPRGHHGMAFGTLAAVNAVGDFLSSLVVGFLWSAVSVRAAFSFSAVLFFAGALIILRLRE